MDILIIGEDCTSKLSELFAALLKTAYPYDPVLVHELKDNVLIKRESPSANQVLIVKEKRRADAIIEGVDLIVEVPNDNLGTVSAICNFADKMMEVLKYLDANQQRQISTVELRTQFAAQAMQGLLANSYREAPSSTYTIEKALEHADELIKQLNLSK